MASVTNRSSRYWRVTTARLVLLWFVLQSIIIVAMSMASSHQCCPGEIQPTAYKQHSTKFFPKQRMPESSFQAGWMDDMRLGMNHYDHAAECEHCTFGGQLIGARSITPNHNVEPLKHAGYQIFFSPSNSLDSPFRPPIA